MHYQSDAPPTPMRAYAGVGWGLRKSDFPAPGQAGRQLPTQVSSNTSFESPNSTSTFLTDSERPAMILYLAS